MNTKLLIGALAVGGVGYWLYRRGRQVHTAVAVDGGVVETLRAGATSVYTEAVAAVPAKTAAPTTQTVSTAVTGSTTTGLQQTVPTHSTYRMTQLQTARQLLTSSDLIAQGIAR